MSSERQVLDHGKIELVDMMGDDWTVVRAARVSYRGELKGPESDTKLIRYMMKHKHTSPFEHVVMTWEVKLPLFVAAQWVRHRTASLNAESARYKEPEMDYYVPDFWRAQHPTNIQGSAEILEDDDDPRIWTAEAQTLEYSRRCDMAIETYQDMLRDGVAREQARMILPQSMYTNWIWTNDLHNTLHFLNLRLNEDAQWEIQQYAEAMRSIMQEKLPVVMGIWEELR